MKPEEIKSAIRARHKLDAGADVRLFATSITISHPDEADPYKFTARITTDSLDRQDEVVIPQGGDLSEFAKSGILSWNHDYSTPIGFPNKSAKISRSEGAIELGCTFMKRPDDYQGQFFPDYARAFVTQARAAGIMPGVSIGFLPLETRSPTKSDFARWGKSLQAVHSKWKLLELAIAPVQANQDAVVTAVGKGLIQRATAKAVGIDVPEVVIVKPSLPPQSIENIILVVRAAAKRRVVDVDALVTRQIERELLRAFGKIYA